MDAISMRASAVAFSPAASASSIWSATLQISSSTFPLISFPILSLNKSARLVRKVPVSSTSDTSAVAAQRSSEDTRGRDPPAPSDARPKPAENEATDTSMDMSPLPVPKNPKSYRNAARHDSTTSEASIDTAHRASDSSGDAPIDTPPTFRPLHSKLVKSTSTSILMKPDPYSRFSDTSGRDSVTCARKSFRAAKSEGGPGSRRAGGGRGTRTRKREDAGGRIAGAEE
mmetsp:Transcript_6068/g.12731  ORF Transcript_6068/g.12731 Transcript_6068/m.12731 type:complete len:228 (+) Transcript_6068:1185-1868(+)